MAEVGLEDGDAGDPGSGSTYNLQLTVGPDVPVGWFP